LFKAKTPGTAETQIQDNWPDQCFSAYATRFALLGQCSWKYQWKPFRNITFLEFLRVPWAQWHEVLRLEGASPGTHLSHLPPFCPHGQKLNSKEDCYFEVKNRAATNLVFVLTVALHVK
jgi:hypothetical protein